MHLWTTGNRYLQNNGRFPRHCVARSPKIPRLSCDVKIPAKHGVGSYSFAPILDRNGVIVGSVVTGHDITESKQAEEALKLSEERYRNIFESAVIGLYRTTPDGNILMANSTLVKMLGFDSFEDLEKRNLEKEGFEDEDRAPKFRQSIERDGLCYRPRELSGRPKMAIPSLSMKMPEPFTTIMAM